MSVSQNLVLLIMCSAILTGCGGSEHCVEPKLYQQAVVGTRVESPPDLDPLTPEREVPVPKASPQAPPPPGTCIDAPPTMRTGSSDS